jgi:hypothetical protein
VVVVVRGHRTHTDDGVVLSRQVQAVYQVEVRLLAKKDSDDTALSCMTIYIYTHYKYTHTTSKQVDRNMSGM